MSRATEHAKQTWEWIHGVPDNDKSGIDWFNSMWSLATAPYTLFLPYDGDANKDRLRGKLVIRDMRPEWIGAKWLVQQDCRIDPAIPFDENPRLKLFRDGEHDYDYFPEEYCLLGYRRMDYGVLYELVVPVWDSKSRPGSDQQSWKIVE